MKNRPNSTQKVKLRLDIANSLVHVVGAILTYVFFANVVSFGEEMQSPVGIGANLIAMALILGIGNWLFDRPFQQVLRWHVQATTGQVQPPAPVEIRRRAVNLPLYSALGNYGMWGLAGLTFGLLNGITVTQTPAISLTIEWEIVWLVLGATLLVGGPIASILSFFINERFWRLELPLFFGQENLLESNALRLPLKRRLAILNITTLIPLFLLAALSYLVAKDIPGSPEPEFVLAALLRLEIFFIIFGLAVAIGLGQSLGASLVEEMERLGKQLNQVIAGNMKARTPVTSNDELGQLADHFNQMTASLEQYLNELQTIHRISQEINTSLDLDETLHTILMQVGQMIDYDAAEICLYETSGQVLRVRAWAQSQQNTERDAKAVFTDTRGQEYRLGEGYTGWIAQEKRSLLVADVSTHQAQSLVLREAAPGVAIRSYLGTPLLLGQDIVGTLEMIATRPGVFDSHELSLLEAIAPQAAVAISNAETLRRREAQLQARIAQLQIEIDEVRTRRQVEEIEQTDFFQDLQSKARQLRSRRKGNLEDRNL